MRTCPKCAKQYDSSYGFCPQDGLPLIEATVPERKLVPGEIIGWRAWDVDKLGKIVRLGSVSHHSIWPVSDWVYAECHDGSRECYSSPDGRTPGDNCTCGLYAARDYDQLTKELPYSHYGNESVRVIGEVAMAGKVVVGTQGYRAEKARVYKLYVPHTHWKLGKLLADTYNVEYELLRWIG